jgi:hypothetical protein
MGWSVTSRGFCEHNLEHHKPKEDTMLTLSEKREVGRYLRERYESTNGRNVRFADDGAVSIMVDAMPNTNQAGRIFAGWDSELLTEARRNASPLHHPVRPQKNA